VRYAAQKFLQFLIVFVIVTFGVLVAVRIGVKDPARIMLGGEPTQAQIDVVTAKYHLGSNYFVQYVYWFKNMLTLDLGRSEIFQISVRTLIRQKVVATLLLTVYTLVLALMIAVPVAVWSAYRRDGWFDRVAGFVSFAFVSIPGVVLGVLLLLTFSVNRHWFPAASTKIYPWDDPLQHVKNFALPTLTLALPISAIFTRLLRGDMILTLQSDFITLARSKGVSPQRVLWRHAFRSSIFSLLTSVGLQFGGLLGGAVLVETLYSLNGLGQLLISALLRSDLLIVQTATALLVFGVVFTNLIVDLLYAAVDPRIRLARALR
jgi:peptide/nickel transport system permease protein